MVVAGWPYGRIAIVWVGRLGSVKINSGNLGTLAILRLTKVSKVSGSSDSRKQHDQPTRKPHLAYQNQGRLIFEHASAAQVVASDNSSVARAEPVG